MKTFLAVFAMSAASPAVADDAAPTPVVVGWIKTFAMAPIEPGVGFEAPEYHASLIAQAARDEMALVLASLGYAPALPDSEGRLTFSVSVDAPAPNGRKKLPQSPMQVSSHDRDPTDNIRDPKIFIDLVDQPRRRTDSAAPELKVTIYARRGEERVWSAYAGAPTGGASREAIARGLVAATIRHFGASVDLADTAIPLAASAPAIQIVEPSNE